MSDNYTKSFISEAVDLAHENKAKFMETMKSVLPDGNTDRLYASFEYLTLVCRHLAVIFATTHDISDEEKQSIDIGSAITVLAYGEQLKVEAELLAEWIVKFKEATVNFERNDTSKMSFISLLVDIYDWQMGGTRTRIEADRKSIMMFNALIMAMFAVEVNRFQEKLTNLK